MVGWADGGSAVDGCSHAAGGRVVTTVVVAPNAFKGTLTAVEAAAAMSAGVWVVHPGAVIVPRPMADGGDGSVDALITAGFTAHVVPSRGPLGHPGEGTIAERDGLVVVELANTCGLLRLPDGARAPLASSTLGLGDAVTAALDADAQRIVLCVGGSASTDGGTGLLVALGARLLDRDGEVVPPGGAHLADIARLDLGSLDPRLARTDLSVATDVDTPLHGPDGAALMFAPQKGATRDEVAVLEAGLRSWSEVVAATVGVDAAQVPGAGAAGGTGFAAIAVLGARVLGGAAFIADAIGLAQALDDADLVLTGEGSFDEQSLRGKGALRVARLARECEVAAVMVCGRITVPDQALRSLGFHAWGSLTDGATEDATSSAAEQVTRRTIEVLAAL